MGGKPAERWQCASQKEAIQSVPHTSLLPHCALVLHPGGSGTVAAGKRHCCDIQLSGGSGTGD